MKKLSGKALALILSVIMVFSVVVIQTGAEGKASGNELPEIKNIIIMIPDGGGFGNYDLAEALKLSGQHVDGMRTQVTTDAIEGEVHEGLYLSDYMVGTSRTRCVDFEVTDSAAGGTAISTGKRTNKFTVGQDENYQPIASILEACQLMGKSTGILTTSTWNDATPAAFASHVKERDEGNRIKMQMLHHGIDIVLGGSNDRTTDGTVTAEDLGYTVVKNAEELDKAVSAGNTHIWSNFADEEDIMDFDYEESDQPTLLEMTKQAIRMLDENIGNDKGFFLMVEGSSVDKGAHASNAVTAAAEYIGFDEAFAYAVNWAKKDGHTLVYGVPDHDTGGLQVNDLDLVLEKLVKGENPTAGTDVIWNGNGGHTGQNVPIWLYAPDGVREKFLEAAGIPVDVKPENIREGKFYDGVKCNDKYAVDNCNIARGAEAVLGFDLENVTEEYFAVVPYRTKAAEDGYTELEESGGIKVKQNCNYYIDPNGKRIYFPYGITVMPDGGRVKLRVPKVIAEKFSRYTNCPFKDLVEGKWYYDNIINVYIEGIMNGKAPEAFEPDSNMTRAELVTVLARMSGDNIEGKGSNLSFTDITDSEKWYVDYVGWAVETGVVKGYEDNTFRPETPVSRSEICVLFDRYMEHMNIEIEDESGIIPFDDIMNIPAWARDSVEKLQRIGLINGDNGNFRPNSHSTRAEIAAITDRFIQSISE